MNNTIQPGEKNKTLVIQALEMLSQLHKELGKEEGDPTEEADFLKKCFEKAGIPVPKYKSFMAKKNFFIESLVRQVGDTLKDPSKVQPNIEFLERIKKEKRIDTNIFGVVEYEKFTSLIPFFQITPGEVLYFRKFVFKEGLEDINHYLISWNGISYMAVYDERIKRFALNEDDFRDRKYNNMLSLGSVKVIGKLEKIEKI